jgi:hypothetical protein
MASLGISRGTPRWLGKQEVARSTPRESPRRSSLSQRRRQTIFVKRPSGFEVFLEFLKTALFPNPFVCFATI